MLLTIIAFLAVLTALVFVHELGHFWVARKAGVLVKEFSLGLPPRAVGLRKRLDYDPKKKGSKKWEWVKGGAKEGEDAVNKNTIYSLSWLPIGGFVRMKGEDDTETGPDSFSEVSPGKRAAILVAGVTMNMLFAVILLGITFGVGFPTILETEEQRAQAQDIQLAVLSVLPDSPAGEAGIKPGDEITSLNGQHFDRIEALQAYTQGQEGVEQVVSIMRGTEQVEVTVVPSVLEQTESVALGVSLAETGIVKYSPPEALWRGAQATVFMTRDIAQALGGIVKKIVSTGRVEEQIAGPVGIAVLTGQAVDLGFVAVLQFAALLSINLAIINIMPFPALDGGQLVFVIIEKLRRKPVSRKVMQYTNTVGFSLLMLLILLITFKDIGTFGIFDAVKNIF